MSTDTIIDGWDIVIETDNGFITRKGVGDV